MSVSALLIHFANFAAPALVLALLLAFSGRIFGPKRPGAPGAWAQAAMNFIAGLVVSAAGLAYFGRDGVMATYAALVFVGGTVQWAMVRRWRR